MSGFGGRRPAARPHLALVTGPTWPGPTRTWRVGRPNRRLGAIVVVTGLAFGAVVVRLGAVQMRDAAPFASLGTSQRLRETVLPAGRGVIFDRNGEDLAVSIGQRTVWADPRAVEDPEVAAALLAPVLGTDVAILRDRLDGPGAFAYLARKVPDAVAAQVEALDLPGVGLYEESSRVLPNGELARSVLGGVDIDNVGIAGVEATWNDALTGEPGRLVGEQDPAGRTIAAAERRVEAPVPGDDLVLTLDRSLQWATEQALAAQVRATRAKGGIAVVMDPATGDILAMANVVADRGGRVRNSTANLAVTTVFEPGSVNKIVTVAAAIEEGRVGPDSVLSVPGSMRVADQEFSDVHEHGVESWTVAEIVERSSNTGTILIARDLGKDLVDGYLRRFGLGRLSGLGFPGESAGILLDPEKWSGTSIATVPIGQGVSVTALQMLGALNVIANDGEWVAPRLVRGIVGADGVTRPAPEATRERVVSSATARAVRAMMVGVVDAEHGTGKQAAVAGYQVAGKTGTARKPREGAVGYQEGAYMSVFAGFVPADEPALSAIVVLDEPRTAIYGGATAAPVFATVARYGLRILGVAPAGHLDGVTVEGPDLDVLVAPEAGVDPATGPLPGRPASRWASAKPSAEEGWIGSGAGVVARLAADA